jgi:hypothetical protein
MKLLVSAALLSTASSFIVNNRGSRGVSSLPVVTEPKKDKLLFGTLDEISLSVRMFILETSHCHIVISFSR